MRKTDLWGGAALLFGVLLSVLPPHFWVTGVLFFGIGGCLLVLPRISKIALRRSLAMVVGIGLVLLEILISLIGTWGIADPQAPACPAAIVLGAQVNGQTPSRILRERLNQALEFAELNPGAVLILSGGQGSGERISEAEAMAHDLTARGVDPKRLLLEDRSTTTQENFRFSAALAREKGLELTDVCVITSEFHMARACYLAGQLGLTVHAYPAKTRLWFYKMNYYVREIPAFFKAILQTKGV